MEGPCDQRFVHNIRQGVFAMTVKIQVKDGFDATATYNVGVTPIANAFDGVNSVAYGGGYTNGGTWANALAGMGNTGWQAAEAAPVYQGCFQTGMSQAAMANARLSDVVAKVGMIDSILAKSIAGIGAQCIATANRIGRIATIDVDLARRLSRLAELDFPAAVGLSNLALMNPMAARMQLQRSAAVSGFNDVPALNAAAHQASIANVIDEGNSYRIVLQIPGVIADAVDMLVVNGKLVIKAKAQAMQTGLPAFANQSLWTREFIIGQDVCIDAIDAIVSNGMLTIVLPKKAAMNTMASNTVATRMSEVAVC
jgi:HSP20 family molecular chaperone IbpA